MSQINDWKKQALDGLAQGFNRKDERRDAAYEAEKDRLYRQIGKLQVEVDWLKKRLDSWDECGRQAPLY